MTLRAEKAETHEEYAWAREAGCRLFQGYFFCRPEVVRDRKVAAGRQSLLQFISTLQDQTVEFNDLTKLITHRGVLGRPLACVVCLETGRPVEAEALVDGASDLYLEAITWVNEAVKPLFAEIREAAAV